MHSEVHTGDTTVYVSVFLTGAGKVPPVTQTTALNLPWENACQMPSMEFYYASWVPSAAAGPSSEHSTFVILVDIFYCLLLWFWHIVIVYFCDSVIHLLSILWLWHIFIVYFCDTSTDFCYTIVTLVLVHIYFLLLWHCYTLIFFFCDTSKHLFSSFVTAIFSASVTPAHIYCLLPWHW